MHGARGRTVSCAVAREVGVGQVDVEQDVVLLHGRAEHSGRWPLHAQLEARQEARALVVEAAARPARSRGMSPKWSNTREGVAVLEHARRLAVGATDVARTYQRSSIADRFFRVGVRSHASDVGRGRARGCEQPAVDAQVVARHARAVKRSSKRARHARAVELADARDRRRPPRRIASTMKPVTPSSMTSGTEPLRQAITGVPHAIASIITRPKGSGQSIGKSSAARVAEEARPCRSRRSRR